MSEAHIGTGDPYAFVGTTTQPPESMRDVLMRVDAEANRIRQAESEQISPLIAAMVEMGVTPEQLQGAVDSVRAGEGVGIEIRPIDPGNTPDFVRRCNALQDAMMNNIMRAAGVPASVLNGTDAGSTASAALARAELTNFQRLIEGGLISRTTALERVGFLHRPEGEVNANANAFPISAATADDIERAWGVEREETALTHQLWDTVSTSRATYAQHLGRPVSMVEYQQFVRIGDMLCEYTRVEDGRDAYLEDVLAYVRAQEAAERPPLTYEQMPRPHVMVDQNDRALWVTIENRDMVPDGLRERLEAVINGWPAITLVTFESNSNCLEDLMNALRSEVDGYLRGYDRAYLSYYFSVRRDMNELSMEEVRAWTGSGPSQHQDGLAFMNTAGTPPPPLYSGFGTKAAWSSDEIDIRQRDASRRSDQVESLLLRLRDICQTHSFELRDAKYTLNASAPVVNNCRTFVFKVMAVDDHALRLRLIVRLLQRVTAEGLSEWGYQVTHHDADVGVRPPRPYVSPEQQRQLERDERRRLAEERRQSPADTRRREAEEAARPPAPRPFSVKPEDEDPPEGRPLDL